MAAQGWLIPLLPAWSLAPGNVHAVYPSRHGHTPALHSVIDFVAQHMPQVLRRTQPDALAGNAGPARRRWLKSDRLHVRTRA
jgi:hypothetical protein